MSAARRSASQERSSISRNGFSPTRTWAFRPQASQRTDGQAPIEPPVGSDGKDLGTTCEWTSISIGGEVSAVMASAGQGDRVGSWRSPARRRERRGHQERDQGHESIIKLTTVRILAPKYVPLRGSVAPPPPPGGP